MRVAGLFDAQGVPYRALYVTSLESPSAVLAHQHPWDETQALVY